MTVAGELALEHALQPGRDDEHAGLDEQSHLHDLGDLDEQGHPGEHGEQDDLGGQDAQGDVNDLAAQADAAPEVVCPDLGAPAYVTVTDTAEGQHDPSVGLARLVQLRDPLCTGPGCSTSSSRSDLDHLKPWPSGPTAAWNLRPKSRRCHRAKTFSWQVSDADDGTTTWTSPHRRSYTVPSPWRPPPTIAAGTRLAPPVESTPDPAPERHDPDEDTELTAMLVAGVPATTSSVAALDADEDECPF